MRDTEQQLTDDARRRSTLMAGCWKRLGMLCLILAATAMVSAAQDDVSSTSGNVATTAGELQTAADNVPRLIKFSGVVMDLDGKPATGAVALTFTLYNAHEEGAALWTETQRPQLDSQGHYNVLLGAGSAAGLPLDVFASGNALWLGVQPELPGAAEQPRVLLVAVPYALKAIDADTLGGKPASAYQLSPDQATSLLGQAATGNLGDASESARRLRPGLSAETSKANQNASPSAIGGGGTLGFIPIWTGSETLGNSVLFQMGDSVGVGTTTPGARVDVLSSGTAVRGTSDGLNGAGVNGISTAVSGPYSNGVYGESHSSGASGVYGTNSSTGNGVTGASYATTSFESGVYGYDVSPSGNGVFGNNSAATGGAGVTGVANASSGNATGVYGQSASTSGSGVGGNAIATSGSTTGTYGVVASPNGIGVNGVNNATTGGNGVSGYANATSGNSDGVYGQANSAGSGTGVYGYATATNGPTTGVFGLDASPEGTGVVGDNSASGGTGLVGLATASSGGIGIIAATDSANGTAGIFGANAGQGLILLGLSGSNSTDVFSVDASGNLDISGNLTVAGSKSARVKLQDGRDVALYAVESPENWFEDFGTGHLNAGAAEVTLDPEFLQTVDTTMDYHVFLTPNGDCGGLYVASKTATGFVVRELRGGNASIAFDYRIVARRRGFEKVRLQEVHLPQVAPEVTARLANLHAIRPSKLERPPRIAVPVVPPVAQQPHKSPVPNT